MSRMGQQQQQLQQQQQQQQQHQHQQQHQQQNIIVEWISMNYIPFGEKALTVAVKLYQQTANESVVVEGQILHEIIKVNSEKTQ